MLKYSIFDRRKWNTKRIFASMVFLCILIPATILGSVSAESLNGLENDTAINWEWEFETLGIFNYPNHWLDVEDDLIQCMYNASMRSYFDLIDISLVREDQNTIVGCVISNGSWLKIRSRIDDEQAIFSGHELAVIGDLVTAFSNISQEDIIIYPRISFIPGTTDKIAVFGVQSSHSFHIFGVTDKSGEVRIYRLYETKGTLDSLEMLMSNQSVFYIAFISKSEVFVSTINFDEGMEVTSDILLHSGSTGLGKSSITLSKTDLENNTIGVFYTSSDGINTSIIDAGNLEVLHSYLIPMVTENCTPYNLQANDFSSEKQVILTWLEVESVYDPVDNKTTFHENISSAMLTLSSITPDNPNRWQALTSIQSNNPFDSNATYSISTPIRIHVITSGENVKYFYSYLKLSSSYDTGFPSISFTQLLPSRMTMTQSGFGELDPPRSIWMDDCVENRKDDASIHHLIWIRDLGLDRVEVVFARGVIIQKSNNDYSTFISFILLLIFVSLVIAVLLGVSAKFDLSKRIRS
ncbi:MAG: hypothetical protein ACTSP4_07915 [Candidatus Hodarchaeales archaeon]